VVNIWHVKAPGSVSTADLDDITAAALTWWEANTGYFHTSYTLQNFTATDISVENGQQTVLPAGSTNAGSATGTAAAANAAACVSLRTAYTGRSFRGRTYFGGLAQSTLNSAQTMPTITAASYATLMTDLIDGLSAVGQTLCVLSRVAAGVVRVTGLLTEVISVLCDTKIDSQRRRTAN
jgi:hypothetical protein